MNRLELAFMGVLSLGLFVFFVNDGNAINNPPFAFVLDLVSFWLAFMFWAMLIQDLRKKK